MATSNYFEKLKDPRWQKKRLEVLDKAGWRCESCGDTSNTLHVHHKQYFKGREPWEYEAGQLSVLCKTCHSDSHDEEDRLLLAASFVGIDGPRDRDTVASLVAGFCAHGLDRSIPDPDAYVIGELAYAISSWSGELLTIIEKITLTELARADSPGLSKALRTYLAAKEPANE